jgi:hypothetical protein
LGDDMGSKQKIPTTADGARKSGRAVFDNQGRASWEWQTATGVFETDVTSDQMQSLEASGLAVVESEQAEPGRVWTTVPRSVVSDASATRRTTGVAPAGNQTVLKRLLRRIAG